MKKLFLRFPGFKNKALTLSYDDGVIQDKRLIALMQQYGIKGTFNINSGVFSDNYSGIFSNRMSLDDATLLYNDSGMEIAVHGVNHISLDRVDSAAAVNEIINDRISLEKIFGRVIKGMAYAYGAYNDEVVNVLKMCGINYARTVISTEGFEIPTDWLRLPATCHHNNPRLMQLAKEFLKTDDVSRWYDAPKLFYLWGHSYEFDNNNNWNIIEDFFKLVGNRNDIWYATNGEIYNYVTAYDRLEFSAESEIVYNPSAIDVYLAYNGVKSIIPAGKTTKFTKTLIW